MVVNISDSEFRELMRVLDPGCTGCVSVGKFTELIEENPKVSFATTSRFFLLFMVGDVSVVSEIRDAGGIWFE